MIAPSGCPPLDPSSVAKRRRGIGPLAISPPPITASKASLRSPVPALPADAEYSVFRQQEVAWLRQMHDHVTKALPKDVFFDPTLRKSNEAALLVMEVDSASEAVMTSHEDKRSRRMARKAALGVERQQDGGFPTATSETSSQSATVDSIANIVKKPIATVGASPTPPASPTVLWGKALNGEMLRRVFTSVQRFRSNRDDKALDLAARVVDRMLSLRKPRMLRCLLRSYLDDVMLLLQALYPSLSRRRADGFPEGILAQSAESSSLASTSLTPPMPVAGHARGAAKPLAENPLAIGDTPRAKHIVLNPKPFATLLKLSCHMAAIEDLIDAVVPPCDDTTFCGLQEFSARLNAMLSTEICKSRLIPLACEALRVSIPTPHVASSRPSLAPPAMCIDDSVRVWSTIHEATVRLQMFISSHCEGDDDDDDDTSSESEASTSRALDLSEEESDASNAVWKPMLRDVAKEAKLFGSICGALSTPPPNHDAPRSDAWTRRKRLAAMTLRSLTQDKETLRYLQMVCSLYPYVWDYILPSLVDDDLCLRQEVYDCVLALISNMDGDELFVGTKIKWILLGSFQDRMLACLDISAEALLVNAGHHSASPTRRSRSLMWGDTGQSSCDVPMELHSNIAAATPVFSRHSSQQTLALISELLYAIHGDKTSSSPTTPAAASTPPSTVEIDSYIQFHKSAVTLIVSRLEDFIRHRSAAHKRLRDGSLVSLASQQARWRSYQPLLAELLQHVRSVVVYTKRERHRARFPEVEKDVPVAEETHATTSAAAPDASSLFGRLYGSICVVAKKLHVTGAQSLGLGTWPTETPSYPLLERVIPADLKDRLLRVIETCLATAQQGTHHHRTNLLYGVCMELKLSLPPTE
jgi:hypothetical protein